MIYVIFIFLLIVDSIVSYKLGKRSVYRSKIKVVTARDIINATNEKEKNKHK